MAKKKEQAEMSVEKKLESLYKLQTLLSKIDEIRTLRGELPLEVQDLEDEVEGLKHRIGRYNDEIVQLRSEVAAKRGKIDEASALCTRYEEQLNEVKNNREYDNLTKEIEFQKLEIQLQEKHIREAEHQIEERQRGVEQSQAQLEERTGDLDVKRAELETIVAETRAEEEKIREQANDLEMNIEQRLLTSFKRIRKNSRNGLGIVYVQRGACGGCFNNVPPQRQLDIRMRKKIIVCEYCGRIMIDPELAGVKVETLAAEKPKRRRSLRSKKAEAKTETPEA